MSRICGKTDSRHEGERILNKIKDDEYVVALCIDGKHYSTSANGETG
ncbi:MAG: hypothetical protein ACLVIY_10530 [Anaerobutyricum soehngenii]